MKVIYMFIVLLLTTEPLFSQTYRGKVVSSSDGEAMVGVSVRAVKSKTFAFTDGSGDFVLAVSFDTDTLILNHLGYKMLSIAFIKSQGLPSHFVMDPASNELQEVKVSTGYSKVSSDRATGSFTSIGNDLINRSVSSNLLNRLEGIANGLQFVSEKQGPHGTSGELRVRGLSTIHSTGSPLIVIDNFPYEGDINSINPNDVESITLLKDAAAASIWGVRAGNGVIVITSKQGKYSQKNAVNFKSNTTVGSKPDIFYNPMFIPSGDMIGFQRSLFEAGGNRVRNNWTLLSPVAELQIAEEEGKISKEEMEDKLNRLAVNDVRNDMYKYLLQNSLNQQYTLSLSGGTSTLKYNSSVGFDDNRSAHVGFSNERITLNNHFTFRLNSKFEINSSINYAFIKQKNNGLLLSDLNPRGGGTVQPYVTFMEESGQPAAIPYKHRQTYISQAESSGLLNWEYRPLTEQSLLDKTSTSEEIRINTAAKYSIFPFLDLEARFQYRTAGGDDRQHNVSSGYYVRDLVNSYTQPDGTRIIPDGGILTGSKSLRNNHYGRVQLNYYKTTARHNIEALSGVEIRQDQSQSGPSYHLYNYDDKNLTNSSMLNYATIYPMRPLSSSRIPNTSGYMEYLTDRYISYYLNGSYTFDNTYTLSVSSRWDASNIFGVATNQKGVPLWSVGFMWNLKEALFPLLDEINVLKFRNTYGINGNINKQVSSLPKISLGSGAIVNAPSAQLLSTGNPSLRWEKVKTFNSALDFALFNNRLSGSAEFYQKKGEDLIGYDFLDPTTGIFLPPSGFYTMDNRINYANIRTRGIDLELRALMARGRIRWTVGVLSSWSKNEVTKYNAGESPSILSFLPASSSGRAAAREGYSLDVIYGLPWVGLNPVSGKMLVVTGEQTNENYAAYWGSLKYTDLKNMGVTVPLYFGSLMNTLEWKQFKLSINVMYKAGHKFRRKSIHYTNLITFGEGHKDYALRWQKPGDEVHTNVPALALVSDYSRDNIYMYNESLIEDASSIRLKDVQLSYRFSVPKLQLRNVSAFMYLNNPGILWRANKSGLDPDFAESPYPAVKTGTLGLSIDF